MPAPSAQGSFAKTPLAHVLVYVHDRALSGSLRVEVPGAEVVLLFREGRPVAAREGAAGPTLGGEGLKRTVLSLFRAGDAEYAYYEGVDLIADATAIQTPVDPYPLLLAGMREGYDEARLRALVVKLLDARVRLRAGAEIVRFDLLDRERRFVALLENEIEVADLAAQSPMPPQATYALLYALVVTRQIDVTMLPGRAASTPAPSAQASAPPPVQQPKPPADAGRSRIADKAARLGQMDLFEVLEVEPSASADEVRDAYFRLAKIYHPDAASKAGYADLADSLSRIFSRITEAHRTLTEPEARERYLQTQVPGSAASRAEDEREVRAALDASVAFQKAEVFLKKQQYEEAEKLAREAVLGNPLDGEYHALLAWVRFLREARPADASHDDLIVSLKKAIELSPRSDRAQFYLGSILKKLGKNAESLDHFRKAAAINPRNVDAAREVRLATIRIEKESKPAPGPGGIFGKLFKK